MTAPLRLALYIGLLEAIFAFGLAVQNPSASSSSSDPNPVAPAVVQLLAVGPGNKGMNQECSATGFLVNENGYILTNAHVAEKSRECLAKSPGARIVAKLAVSHGVNGNSPHLDAAQGEDSTSPAVSCDVLEVDDVRDLAVMKTERPFRTSAPGGTGPYVFLSAGEVTSGTRVIVTGHPAFAWIARTQAGQVLTHKSISLFERSSEQTDVIVLDIPLKHGNSGSPVYLEKGGAVVGIIERQNTPDSSQTLAVPIHYAIDLLDRLGVKWHDAPSPH